MSEKKKLSNDIKNLIKLILIENKWESRSSQHISLVKFLKKDIEIYTINELREYDNFLSELEDTSFTKQEIQNILKLVNHAKFEDDVLEFLEIFSTRRKWKSTSKKIYSVKKIFVKFNLFSLSNFFNLMKTDKNLHSLRQTKLTDIQVDDILFILDSMKKKDNNIDPNNYNLIKQKIKDEKLTSDEKTFLFEEYGLEPYNNYLKQLLIIFLENQI